MGRQFILAAQLLTILPLPSSIRSQVSSADLGRSMRYYPLVGLAMGAMLAAAQHVLSRGLPPVPVATIVLVLLVILSGALHMDGFADMCDGFYKGRDKSEILAIMKDSHSGAMAVVGIACLFALKLSFLWSLWSLPQAMVPRALILMPAAGRWTMVLLASSSQYARSEGGTAKGYVDHAGPKETAIAALSIGLAGWLILQGMGLIILLGVSLFALIFRQYVISKIGGVTGDVLGACGEMSECIFLLGVCLASGGR